MPSFLLWIVANWQTLLVTLLSIIGGASVIVRAIAPLTSTTKDDEAVRFLDKVYGWLNKLALNTPPNKDS